MKQFTMILSYGSNTGNYAYILPLQVLLCLCLVLSLSLAGCSERTEDGKTTLHFVTWKPNVPAAWDELITVFEDEHPDLIIKRETGPHSSTAFHDMLTQKLKNKSTDVDVFLMDVIWPPEFAAAGWAASLDELYPEEEQKKFLEGSVLANSYKGKIYGVPLFVDSGIMFFRRDLVEKHYGPVLPETWNEMINQAQVIVTEEAKNKKEIYGFSGQFKQYEGLVCDMMEYVMSNGGQILDRDTGQPALAGPRAVEAVRFVRDNIIGKAAPEGVLTYQEPESLDLFIQGKAVFHRNWPYAWQVSNDPGRSKIAGKVGIMRLPYFAGGKSFSTLGGWQVGISSHSKNREAAWKFVQFLSGDRGQKILALKAGKAPTRKALYNDEEILKAYPHFSEMKDVFLTAYPRPRTPLYPAVSNVLQRYFSKAISDKTSDIEKEAKAASEEISKILAMEKGGK